LLAARNPRTLGWAEHPRYGLVHATRRRREIQARPEKVKARGAFATISNELISTYPDVLE
jgi:hypothetical protein